MPTRPSASHPDDAGAPGEAGDEDLDRLAPEAVDDEHAPVVGAGVPAVVAVVVTADAGPRFEESLRGLADQEYANLTVVVLDRGCPQDPTARIAEILPTAFVRTVSGTTSFGVACNDVLGTIEGATFLLFCHDDTCLAPDAIQALVTEAFRSNGGVVGPKLVDWDEPERLQSVGFGVDKFGSVAPLVEPGELDQSQHDVVREVFMVPSAAVLVRADLFADLEGFDTELSGQGADLDLCWRAWVAGAHVVIMPGAVARHAGDSPGIDQPVRDLRLAPRHEARAFLTCSGVLQLVRVLPQAVVLSVLDLLASLLTGHLQRAADVATAWGWNLAHLPGTIRMRGRVHRSRRAGDREIREQQLRGSARLSRALRDVRTAGGRRLPGALAAARDLPATWQDGTVLPGVALAVILGAAFLIGSRQLFSGGVPAVRQFAPLGDPTALLREWWTGWRSSGMGQAGSAPTLFPVLAVARIATLGHSGVLRTLALLAGLPAGAFGAWRLLRDVAGARARIATTVAYVLVPVPYDAIAEGRWGVLAVYAVAPWVVGRLLRIGGAEPFDTSPRRGLAREGLALGFVLAAGALISPAVVPLGVGVALLMALGLVLAGDPAAARRIAVSGLVAGVGAAVLLAPTTLDLVARSDRWAAMWGTGSTDRPRLGELVRLSTGSTPGGVLWLAVPLVAVLVLLVGRSGRLRTGALGWGLAIAGWGVAILVYRWWPDSPRPASGMLLAPAAAGLALAVGLGVEAFDADVRGRSFGWRQAAAGAAAVVGAVGVVPFLAVAVQGRWNLPQGDAVSAMSSIDSSRVPSFRTLWLGAPDVLPLAGSRVSAGLTAAITTGVQPSLSDVQPAALRRPDRLLLDVVRSSLDGGSARLGRRLAPFGIRYVVVVTSLSSGSPVVEPPSVASARLVLGQQLDLNSLEIAPGLDVYQSSAWIPVRAVAAPGAFAAVEGGRAATSPPVVSTAVLRRGSPPSGYSGTLPAGRDLRVALAPSGGWVLRIAGRTVPAQRTGDWALRYAPSAGGSASLTYDAPGGHLVFLVVQLLLVVALAGVVIRGRAARP